MTTRRPVRVALAAIACLLVAACSKVSEESFGKIHDGMTLAQVQRILGEGDKEESAGTSISSAGLAGSSNSSTSNRQTYSWKDGDSQIIVDFTDDKVVAKRKNGF